LYGPTEAAISCTEYELPNDIERTVCENGIVAIGKPFKHTNTLVLKDKHIPTKENIGELLLSGKQVIKSYLDNENSNSFVKIKDEIYYKTGDLVFKDSNGNLMFVGRKDTQVKIQGYRVELQEIEYAIESFNKEINAVVLIQKANNSDILTAFVLNLSENKDELRSYLQKKLPPYMIPQKYKVLEEFPLNKNGKVDRNKLITM
jgi:acyl-CoA synthetase (AMP-forming)/AMP-acid ligase II